MTKMATMIGANFLGIIEIENFLGDIEFGKLLGTLDFKTQQVTIL